MGQGTQQVNPRTAAPGGKKIARDHKIIVSFTSISTRIQYINPMIRSLLEQSLVPNEIYLWISEDPFLHDEGIPPDKIPDKLTGLANLENSPFRIGYTENTAGYRKLIPTMEKFLGRDDVVIVTADDDTIYPPQWLEVLYRCFIQHRCITAYRARKIAYKADGSLEKYDEWPLLNSWDMVKDLQLCPTGNDGVLYSPAFFDERILDPVYKKLSPTRADFWYAGNAIANNIPTLHLPTSNRIPGVKKFRKDFRPIHIPEEVQQKWPELYKSNQPKNDEYAANVFRHFSIID